MKRLFTIVSVMIFAGITMSPVVFAEKRVFNLSNEILASSEYKREMKKEFDVSSMPTLNIKNEFGSINIIEGADDKIIFKITITGKGKNNNLAREYAQTVNVDFAQNGNDISAKTVFERLNCENCGRNVNYEVTVPKKTKLSLDSKFGDIKLNNVSEPVDIQIAFGKLYANVLSEAKVKVQHGGATINKCESLTINSDFSKNKLGEVGSVSGRVSHGGIDIEQLGSAKLKSEFSNVNIQSLKKSFDAETFSHGSLTISDIDYNFSNINVKASFTKVRVLFNENHSFKAILYCNFGSINTGNVAFYEKSLDKKDAVVGIVGKTKEPSPIVDISNSHGNISFK